MTMMNSSMGNHSTLTTVSNPVFRAVSDKIEAERAQTEKKIMQLQMVGMLP